MLLFNFFFLPSDLVLSRDLLQTWISANAQFQEKGRGVTTGNTDTDCIWARVQLFRSQTLLHIQYKSFMATA